MVGQTPLVPAEVDLTDFGFMPLDVRRLRDSRIAATANGEEFRAAVLLWCAAWHQKPAASLPDDDVELAQLAGYGRIIREWKKVREGALHGWVKCTDGRLYHPVVAEKANDAWAEKLQHAWSRECDRIRKENKRRAERGEEPLGFPSQPSRISAGGDAGNPADVQPTSSGLPAENALKGQGQGQGKEKEQSPPSQALGGALPPPPEPLLLTAEDDSEIPAALDRRAYPDEFESLWRDYRPVASPNATKADAHKAWAKLSATDRAACATGLKRYVSWLCDERRRRPDTPAKHLATFVNKRGWEPFLERTNGSAGGAVAPKDEQEAELRMRVARERRQWPSPKWGPRPNDPGCLIPPALIRPDDGTGWAEWGEGT